MPLDPDDRDARRALVEARVGAHPAPPGRPDHQRDPPRLRVRQRRRRPLERRRRMGRAAARRLRPLGPPHPRRAARHARRRRRRSSSPTPSGGRGATGLTDVAIGVAGLAAVVDLRGTEDAHGRELQVTEVAVADEVAAAAELVMGKAAGVPVAIVRGLDPPGSARAARRSSSAPRRGPLPVTPAPRGCVARRDIRVR